MNRITETNLEKGTYDCFNVWLKSFFDGAAHPVGLNAPVIFPKALLGFGQTAFAQPMNGVPAAAVNVAAQVGINVTFGADTGTQVKRRWASIGGTRQQRFYKPVRLNFWVRCDTADDKGRALCLQAGQLLEAILGNAATAKPLAQCGIHRVRPGSSQPVADSTYILRLVPCHAVLKYAVLSQGGTLTEVLSDLPPGLTPTARLKDGIFEIWDVGRAAYVPLLANNGAVGTGDPDVP